MDTSEGLKNGFGYVGTKGDKTNWDGNMPQRTQIIPLSEMVKNLTQSEKDKLLSGCDLKNLARIFEDEDMMVTVKCFFENGMNVSETARKLYMHRNTLIYRLSKIGSVTGLDIRLFDSAVTFEILRILYTEKRG